MSASPLELTLMEMLWGPTDRQLEDYKRLIDFQSARLRRKRRKWGIRRISRRKDYEDEIYDLEELSACIETISGVTKSRDGDAETLLKDARFSLAALAAKGRCNIHALSVGLALLADAKLRSLGSEGLPLETDPPPERTVSSEGSALSTSLLLQQGERYDERLREAGREEPGDASLKNFTSLQDRIEALNLQTFRKPAPPPQSVAEALNLQTFRKPAPPPQSVAEALNLQTFRKPAPQSVALAPPPVAPAESASKAPAESAFKAPAESASKAPAESVLEAPASESVLENASTTCVGSPTESNVAGAQIVRIIEKNPAKLEDEAVLEQQHDEVAKQNLLTAETYRVDVHARAEDKKVFPQPAIPAFHGAELFAALAKRRRAVEDKEERFVAEGFKDPKR